MQQIPLEAGAGSATLQLEPGCSYLFWYYLPDGAMSTSGTMSLSEDPFPAAGWPVPFRETITGEPVVFDLTEQTSGRIEFVAISKELNVAIACDNANNGDIPWVEVVRIPR